MAKIGLLTAMISILSFSCNEEKIQNQNKSVKAEKSIKYIVKDTLSDSSALKNDNISTQNNDTSVVLPEYYDYQSEVLAHLKRNIGKAYSIEIYNKFIDSNKTKLHKLIREYHQKKKMTLDTNESDNKIDTTRKLPEENLTSLDYHSVEVFYFKRYINKAYSKEQFEKSIDSNISLLDSLVNAYKIKNK
ncbi:MAG: hypothetical protein ACE364_07435 [Chlorobiota bacterium]